MAAIPIGNTGFTLGADLDLKNWASKPYRGTSSIDPLEVFGTNNLTAAAILVAAALLGIAVVWPRITPVTPAYRMASRVSEEEERGL